MALHNIYGDKKNCTSSLPENKRTESFSNVTPKPPQLILSPNDINLGKIFSTLNDSVYYTFYILSMNCRLQRSQY